MLEITNDLILETEWGKFEKLVIPADAPEIQRTEMRKAFYAGALLLMELLSRLEDDSLSDEMVVLILMKVKEEILNYALSLKPDNDTSQKFYWQ